MAQTQLQYPNVNGIEYSWASVTITIFGTNYFGITSINYSDKLDPALVPGTSSLPLGWTRGKWDQSLDWEMKKYDGQVLLNALGDGYGLVQFPIQVQYAETNMPAITDQLPVVRITSVADGGTAGSDPSKLKFTGMQLVPIKRNGVSIVPALTPNAPAPR